MTNSCDSFFLRKAEALAELSWRERFQISHITASRPNPALLEQYVFLRDRTARGRLIAMSKTITQSVIKQAFVDYLSRETDESRQAYLDELRSSTPKLAEEIMSLQQLADTEPGSSSDSAPANSQMNSSDASYELLERIGEGGMGTVFLANQTTPIAREVAIKVVKPGMDSEQVIARFDNERQSLALMNHPNIAKIFDAGTTEKGRPFFVMELARGTPLTSFCKEHQLSINRRLELFIDLCDGIEHAHQRGVIHRDIKPGNVQVTLSDGRPIVKIIDFGIAKAIDQNLSEDAVLTLHSQLVGTPLYMSPEQAGQNGTGVDTRSDIYSLGVMLYELVTDSTPLDSDSLKTGERDQLFRAIREIEPPPPSQRLASTTSALGQGESGLSRSFRIRCRKELDWIAMKALAKEPDRRYETATAFREDIQRFLANEPINARPPSVKYRWSKFAIRNRMLLGTAAVVLLSLVVGLCATAWQAARATDAEALAEQRLVLALQEQEKSREEAKRAQEESEIATAIADFLQNDLLSVTSMEGQVLAGLRPEPDLKVRTLLDRASDRIDGGFKGSPRIRQRLHMTLGNTYMRLGLPTETLIHAQKAYDIDFQLEKKDAVATSQILRQLVSGHVQLQNYGEAEKVLQQASLLKLEPSDQGNLADEELLMMKVVLAFKKGRYETAIDILKDLIASCEDRYGPEHRRTLAAQSELATNLVHVGKLDEALALDQKLLEIRERHFGGKHPDVLKSKVAVGVMFNRRKDYLQAHEHFLTAYQGLQETVGPDAQTTLDCAANFGCNLTSLGRLLEAQTTLEAAVTASKNSLGIHHETTHLAEEFLATLYGKQGKLAQAIELREKLLKNLSKRMGLMNPKIIRQRYQLAELKFKLDPNESNQQKFQSAVFLAEQHYGSEAPTTLTMKNNFATALSAAGLHSHALEIHQEVLQLHMQLQGPQSIAVIGSEFNIATSLIRLNRSEDALQLLTRLTKKIDETPIVGHPLVSLVFFHYGRQLANLSSSDKKVESVSHAFRKAYDSALQTSGSLHRQTLMTFENLLAWMLAQDELNLALKLVDSQSKLAKQECSNDPVIMLGVYRRSSRALYQSKWFEQAIPHLEAYYRCLTESGRLQEPQTLEVLKDYVDSCEQADMSSRAIHLLQSHIKALKSSDGDSNAMAEAAKQLLNNLRIEL